MAQKVARPYTALDQLRHVYLEDSYVLGISESEANVDFLLDLVLTEDHPAYAAPRDDEQYCYRRALLRFPNVTRAAWDTRVVVPARDATGSVDYGSIDTFVVDRRSYRLTGDWGSVTVESDPPVLRMLEPDA